MSRMPGISRNETELGREEAQLIQKLEKENIILVLYK